MIGKSVLACSLLVPALGLASGTSTESRAEERPTDSAAAVELLNDGSTPDVRACAFDILAINNLSFDVWVDLYYSTVMNRGKYWDTVKQLKIQNHRLATGTSMRRRYTASGSCSRRRIWKFYVRIGRADGRKLYKYVLKSTKDSGERTVNLGKSTTWGL